jgi:hypothetical protein
MKNRLVVDLDLPVLLSRLRTIRTDSKNPDGRANLAVLEGILQSYGPLRLDSVRLQASASQRALELFSEFVEEHAYRSMSRQAHSLGYPKLLRSAGQEFSRLARVFVRSRKHRDDVSLGKLLIAVVPATFRPWVRSKGIDLGSLYLPPIVSFEEARERASKAYDALYPGAL